MKTDCYCDLSTARPQICCQETKTAKIRKTRNVGQCPTWWSPCWTQVAPSVQRSKVWLTLTTWLLCSNAAKTRKPLKLAGSSKLQDRSQPLVGESSPYCGGHLEDILLLNKFVFPIVDTRLSCEDIARQSCTMVRRWRFFASCISSKPPAAHCKPES